MTNHLKMQKQLLAASQVELAEPMDELARQIKSRLETLGYENIHVKVANKKSTNPAIQISSARLFIDEFGRDAIAGRGPVAQLLMNLKMQRQETSQ